MRLNISLMALFPRITWTLYNADNSVKAYEHFDIPMLMAVDKYIPGSEM